MGAQKVEFLMTFIKKCKGLLRRIKRKLKDIQKQHNGKLLIQEFSELAQKEEKEFIFSIVIAVYNTEDYLAEAIESVLNQKYIGYKHTQIILINDGSTDRSEEICQYYQQRFSKNIIFISQKNRGVSAARNLGIDAADGLYLNFLDSDDKW